MYGTSKLVRESDADIRTWLYKCNEILKAQTGKTIPELKVNLPGQRDIEETWKKSVNNLMAIHLGFRFGMYDPIKVNQLPDGSVNVPDGQHRLIAVQYLWKELIDNSIEVPFFAKYTRHLYHQEIKNVKGFDADNEVPAKQALFSLVGNQQTVRSGGKNVPVKAVVA